MHLAHRQVDGVRMRWPDSAAIKDSQGLFMAGA